jgi:cell wall-associated NlpC family hydrolase
MHEIVSPRLALLLLSSVTLSACASSGAVPRPFPMPGAPPAASTKPSTDSALPTDGYSVSSTALALRGAPYRNGGVDPSGFDCSGLVKYVFEQHGVALPRDTKRQFAVGATVDPAALVPGDLVFFTTVAPGASHVGSTNTGVVRVEHLSSQYWSTRFVGAKRIF